MKRRSLLASLCALPLLSCQGEDATIRFKVIASVRVDGRPMESSSVMEITYSKVTHSLIGNGGATRLRGEALICKLGSRGTLYILPILRYQDGGINYNIYEFKILRTLGIEKSVGSLTADDFDILRAAKGRRRYNVDNTSLPTFVAFVDEANPKTVYQVDPTDLGSRFPGVAFNSLDIEITDEPLTEELRKRLPWLNSQNKVFDRDPPGHIRPLSKRPIGFVLTKDDFFGDGSR